MALVDRRGLTRQTLPAVAAGRAAAKKQRRHRVIIENVEQKQLKTTVGLRRSEQIQLARKLTRPQISFQVRPPNGYTFIPAGNPDLTNALKEASREANQQIYAVSASPHSQVHDLSKEVHRIGFHFPTIIVAQVCQSYGITLTSKGEVAHDNADTFRQMRQNGGRNNGNDDKKKDQVTINTDAKLAIKDLFPKIPQDDLFTIIKGAFQKGQKKVGTANELPLVRRAQLSVVAHVRHVYTRYDKLLREVGYREARAQVEHPTLRKLVEWRGDDDNTSGDNKHGLEEVMREVIVLSDAEDSEDDTDDVMSTKETAWPVPSHQSVAYAHPLSPRQYNYLSGDDNVPGYRVVAPPPRRRLVDAASQNQASTQFRQSRYAAWDRARDEYRADPSKAPTALVPLSQHDSRLYYPEPEFNFNDSPIGIRQDIIDTRRPEQYASYADRQVVHERRPVEIDTIRGADGVLYERTITQQQASMPQRRHDLTQTYVSSQPPSPRHAPLHEGYDPRVQAVSSHILPSIEDNQPSSPGDSRSRVPQHDVRVATSRRLDDVAYSDARPRNVQVIDLTDSADAQLIKRRRVEEPPIARRYVKIDDTRRPLGQLRAPQDADRSARESQYQRREIIDLSIPTYVREPLPASSRVVAAGRQIDSRMEGQGNHPDMRAFRPLVEVQHNVAATRYASGPETARDQLPASGLQSQRIRHEGQFPYSEERRYAQPADENYHPEDPVFRTEHVVGRQAARVPVYESGSISYSREYIPVIRNEVLMPDPAAQRRLPIYADPARMPQDVRYERMPPPTYVRN